MYTLGFIKKLNNSDTPTPDIPAGALYVVEGNSNPNLNGYWRLATDEEFESYKIGDYEWPNYGKGRVDGGNIAYTNGICVVNINPMLSGDDLFHADIDIWDLSIIEDDSGLPKTLYFIYDGAFSAPAGTTSQTLDLSTLSSIRI